jgi:GMP synthase (glutamine-hydrolysing)
MEAQIMKESKILIFDFGSQTCHLILRRLKDLGIKAKIVDPEISIKKIKKIKPSGIIFSGGPASVYEKGAPTTNPKILNLNIPVLGICYGWQLIARLLGGQVVSGSKEYGPANLEINLPSLLLKKVDSYSKVWLSHGDTVVCLPKNFKILAKTKDIKTAVVANFKKKIYGVQFHPEVEHTQFGKTILKNFVKEVCDLKIKKRVIKVEKIIKNIKKIVGDKKVVCAVSGGVDSSVTAVLITKAIGKNVYPVYIESGLMRKDTKKEIISIFKLLLHKKPVIIEAKKLFLNKLKGVTDPEKKRKIIGNLYIKLFEKQAKKLKNISFLAQGTIYSDVIESRGTKKSAKIKSHHNVAGLPEKMNLKLLEPLKYFYKDEVRQIAKKLNLPLSMVNKQPFPGPGQAIRILGEVTEKRLKKQQQADQIVLEELKKTGWLKKVFQSFSVLTNIKSTAVKGDGRFYGEVVALRIYNSADIMTTNWTRLPYEVLQKICSRIVNEVPEISRVVYDITTKPPATMEWE